MRVCVIDLEKAKVVNVIELGASDLPSNLEEATVAPEGHVFLENAEAGPGWLYQNGELLPPAIKTDATESMESTIDRARTAALRALDDVRLATAALDTSAPAEVKEYAAALDAAQLRSAA